MAYPRISRLGPKTALRRASTGLALLAAALTALAAATGARAESAALVLDGNTGNILYSYNIDKPHHPASLTKVMTIYLAFEALRDGRLKPDQRLRVSRKAARQSPSRIGLKAGRTIAASDAILALITKSANDASVVLAEAIDGSEEAFARRMTERARTLRMRDTVFHNASGLHHRDQVTTARDMAKLSVALLRDFPNEYRQFATHSFQWRGRRYRNHNPLLASYNGADGIKTGYIRQSGYNLIASAERGGRRVISVILGSRDSSHREWTAETLLDYGFMRLGDGVSSAGYPGLPYIGNPQGERALAIALGSAGAPPAIVRKPAVSSLAIATVPGTRSRNRAGSSGARNWAIQVGAYRDALSAEEAAARAAERVSAVLGGKIAVVPVTRGGQRMYRARLTGLSESQAREACILLSRQQMPCLAVADTGEFRTSSLR
jgi:D-alanyl-D-alanine carboxypeptidase